MKTFKICAAGAFLLLSPAYGEGGDLCAPSSPRAVVVNAGETLTLKTRCSGNWVDGTNSYKLCSDQFHDQSFYAAHFAGHSGWSSDAHGWFKVGFGLAACKAFCENTLRGCTGVKSDGSKCYVLKNREAEKACAGTANSRCRSPAALRAGRAGRRRGSMTRRPGR